MMTWRYGDTTDEGIYINESIQTNIYNLYSLLCSLKSYNIKLVGFNTEGVVLEHKSYSYEDLSPQLEEMKERFRFLENCVSNIVLDNKNESQVQEVSSEFFLLFDLLPEHIKKELKIYINKKYENNL